MQLHLQQKPAAHTEGSGVRGGGRLCYFPSSSATASWNHLAISEMR